MNGWVVDASVAIKWFIDEQGSDQAVGLLQYPLSAPDLLMPECANILWKKVMRGELQANEAATIALALEGAAISLHSTRPSLASATVIACDLRRAAYDCFYLALAQELRQPLITADLRLVNAVRGDRAGSFAKLVVPLSEVGAG